MCVQCVTRVPLTWNREREQKISLTIIVASRAMLFNRSKQNLFIFNNQSKSLLRLHFCFSTLRSSLLSQVVRLFFNIEKIRSANFFSFSLIRPFWSINQSVNEEQVFNSKQVDLFCNRIERAKIVNFLLFFVQRSKIRTMMVMIKCLWRCWSIDAFFPPCWTSDATSQWHRTIKKAHRDRREEEGG